jgi:hypothetical protein
MRANALDLRYGDDPKGERWELCEKVLARNDVKKRLLVVGASGRGSKPNVHSFAEVSALITGQYF